MRDAKPVATPRARWKPPRRGEARKDVVSENEGNPPDIEAPDSSRWPEPAPPPLDEPPAEREIDSKDRLSKQVPIGLLFVAASAVILLFLAIVAGVGYFALSPGR